VAAGAVAKDKVEPLTVVGGVPAHLLGVRRDEGLQYTLDEPLPLLE
jgi:acetyltransferase-like isoleucine patch superfamily enzyme